MTPNSLFYRVFSYIKYKTLPPSFLFKNRLMVERNAKSRHIMASLGSTFRNAKWTSYVRRNTIPSSVSDFVGFAQSALGRIFIFMLIFSFSYYTFPELVVRLFAPFFMAVDSTICGIWFGFIAAPAAVVWTVHYVFVNFALSRTGGSSLGILGSGFDTSGVQLSKSDLTLAFTRFLTRGTDRTNVTNSLVMLFDSNRGGGRTSAELVKRLYWLSYLNRMAVRQPVSTVSGLDLGSRSVGAFGLASTLRCTSGRVLLSEPRTSALVSSSTGVAAVSIYSQMKEGLDVLGREGVQAAGLIKSRRGNFYLNISSADLARRLGGALAFQAPVLVDQASVARWHRWVYRYNLLHRSSVSAAHNLTMSKKLISSGYFDSALQSRNLWASGFFAKSQRRPVIRLVPRTMRALYGDVLTGTNAAFSNLNFYEESYFWNLKRFYLLNTLASNKITSGRMMSLASTTVPSVATASYMSNVSNLTTSLITTNGAYLPLMSAPSDAGLAALSGYSNRSGDISLDFEPGDLLSGENLLIFTRLTSPILNSHGAVLYFSPIYGYTLPSTSELTFSPEAVNVLYSPARSVTTSVRGL